jgi:hypothetical protein
MWERQAIQLRRQFDKDRVELERLLASYRHPDPRIAAIEHGVSAFANMMRPQALAWEQEYDGLSRRASLPPDLRLQARVNRKLAAELHDLLTDLSLPWLRSQQDACDAG